MLQPQPNPRDEELLEEGMLAIWQELRKGNITLKDWFKLSVEWRQRVLDDDEDVEGCYSPHTLES